MSGKPRATGSVGLTKACSLEERRGPGAGWVSAPTPARSALASSASQASGAYIASAAIHRTTFRPVRLMAFSRSFSASRRSSAAAWVAPVVPPAYLTAPSHSPTTPNPANSSRRRTHRSQSQRAPAAPGRVSPPGRSGRMMRTHLATRGGSTNASASRRRRRPRRLRLAWRDSMRWRPLMSRAQLTSPPRKLVLGARLQRDRSRGMVQGHEGEWQIRLRCQVQRGALQVGCPQALKLTMGHGHHVFRRQRYDADRRSARPVAALRWIQGEPGLDRHGVEAAQGRPCSSAAVPWLAAMGFSWRSCRASACSRWS